MIHNTLEVLHGTKPAGVNLVFLLEQDLITPLKLQFVH